MKIKKITQPSLLILLGLLALYAAAYLTRKVEAPVTQSIASESAAPLSNAAINEANIFVNLVKKVVPSVVNIQTLTNGKRRGGMRGGSPEDLFRKFFGEGGLPPRGRDGSDGRQDPGAPQAMALGTGFIIDASGLILTNNHVVADADEIKIQFTEKEDEAATAGEVVGRDPELDLALIKVKTKRTLIPLNLGDSDSLQVGEYVMAVGNPFGQGHSATHGIISAKERKAPDALLANYLQTDTPINPGNSGGPLVNLKGEVIGINNAIDQRAQGIGFAIPINLVKNVLNQLKTKGSVARGYIGVGISELNPEISKKLGIDKDLKGAMVTQVYKGEPADLAGIQAYDVIVGINGKKVKNSTDLIAAVTAIPVGESVPIEVIRNGKSETSQIKVSKRPTHPTLAQAPKREGGGKTHIEVGMELLDLNTSNPEIREAMEDLDLSHKSKGALVTEIAFGGPADRAGLARGDLIIEVDRKPIDGTAAFFELVNQKKDYMLRIRRLDATGREVFSVLVLSL